MKTNKKLPLFICGLAVIGITISITLVKRERVPHKTIQPSEGSLDFTSDLDYLVSQMKSLGSQLTNQADFASDVIRECESMRRLFARSFQLPIKGSIDFILQVHPKTLGEPNPPGYDTEESRELVSKVILGNKYDIVTFEGSVFDGFSIESRTKEVHARLKYQPESPLYKALLQRGVEPSSYEQAQPYLLGLVTHQGIGKRWYELETKTHTSFLAGESLTLTTLMGKIMSGEIGHADTNRLIENVQKLRSTYALAKTIKDLKDRSAKHAAIVFGFLHENDFKNLASALCINARVYDATGINKK